jgi:hypothetical protein
MLHEFTCFQCGQNKTHESPVSTGYGRDKNDNKICFDCCGINDAKELTEMPIGAKTVQYWDGKNIINWPSSLKITPYYTTKGRHNMARTREDIYFRFNGFNFHATQYGNNSQIAHIRKTK